MINFNKIKYWRQELYLNQHEFADAVQIPRWKINMFEMGTVIPTEKDIEAMAKIIGVEKERVYEVKNVNK